jgi:carbamate kinase
MAARAVAVLTHAEVARDDPAFATPEQGDRRADVRRRVIASPRPQRIVEADQIRALLGAGAVMVAAGGGGIPVLTEDGGQHSVDTVIDKDHTSALLAAVTGVDTIVLGRPSDSVR